MSRFLEDVLSHYSDFVVGFMVPWRSLFLTRRKGFRYAAGYALGLVMIFATLTILTAWVLKMFGVQL